MHAYKVLFLDECENFVFCEGDFFNRNEYYGTISADFGIYRNMYGITFFSSSSGGVR